MNDIPQLSSSWIHTVTTAFAQAVDLPQGLDNQGILAGTALPQHYKSDITLPVEEFHTRLDHAAQHLLGMLLCRRLPTGEILTARIVEIETYDQFDPASHCYTGFTFRNRAMFTSPLHAYIYISHGIHSCMNISLGPLGVGAGALIRAVEPIDGVQTMEKFRNRTGTEVSNGPAKLCQALQISTELYGRDLSNPSSPLFLAEPLSSGKFPQEEIVATPRIGISKNASALRRFVLADNPYVSAFHHTTDSLQVR